MRLSFAIETASARRPESNTAWFHFHPTSSISTGMVLHLLYSGDVLTSRSVCAVTRTMITMKKVLLSAQITRPSVLAIGPKTLPARPAPTYGAGYGGIGRT